MVSAPNDTLTTDTLAVGDRGGMVVLEFPKPVTFVLLDPATAGAIGEAMARRAYKVVAGDDPTPQRKSFLADRAAAKLRVRVEHMIRSMSNEGVDPKIQAARVVEECLKEVT